MTQQIASQNTKYPKNLNLIQLRLYQWYHSTNLRNSSNTCQAHTKLERLCLNFWLSVIQSSKFETLAFEDNPFSIAFFSVI